MFIVNLIGTIVSAFIVSLWIAFMMWLPSLNLYQGLQNVVIMVSGLATVGIIMALWHDSK